MLLGLSSCARAAGKADLPGLVATCTGDPDGPACVALLAKLGVSLPTSTGVGTWDPVADAVFVAHDGRVHARDWSGHLDDMDFHRLPGLAGVLPRIEAVDDEPVELHPTLVFADQGVSYGAVVDVLHTADRNHLAPLQVGVQTLAGPAALPIGAPRSWHPDDQSIADARCCMHVALGVDTVELDPCGREPVRHALQDLAAIADVAAAEPSPNRCVVVHGEGGIRWSHAIAVLDAIRSPGCPLVADRADRARGCRPIDVTLDRDPPIPWRPGNWDAVSVSVKSIELREQADNPRDEATLRRQADAALPRVTECLRTSDAMRLQRPAEIFVLLMTDGDREVSVALDGHRPNAVPLCVAEAFAPPAYEVARLLPGDAEIVLAIELPVDPAGDLAADLAPPLP